MIFLASFIFVVLMFVIPGELLLVWLAHLLSDWDILARFGLPPLQNLIVLNTLVYVALVLSLRFSTIVYRDFRVDRGRFNEQLLDLLSVRCFRWINFLGFAALAGGTAILLLEGRLPFPFWFLFGASVLGFFDLFGKTKLLPLPSLLPEPRVLPTPAPEPGPEPEPEPDGRKILFKWILYSPGDGRKTRVEQPFVIGHDEYKAKRELDRHPRRPLKEYARYVTNGVTESVERIINWFRLDSLEHDHVSVEEIMNVVGFVRGIEYKSDEETRNQGDYANYPVETLYDEAGDCEDHAILAAAVLRELGHDVALFHLKLDGSGHLALGYCPPWSEAGQGSGAFQARAEGNGRDYLYVETVPTQADREFGELSEEFLSELKKAEVILLDDEP